MRLGLNDGQTHCGHFHGRIAKRKGHNAKNAARRRAIRKTRITKSGADTHNADSRCRSEIVKAERILPPDIDDSIRLLIRRTASPW